MSAFRDHDWLNQLQGEWLETPPAPAYPPKERPYLVVAATHYRFTAWCQEQRLQWLGAKPQAVFLHRPEQLYGRPGLLDDLVVLDYPVGERGRELREEVERRLATERAIRERQ